MSESLKESGWFWNARLGRATPRPPAGKDRLRELGALYRRGLLNGDHHIHPAITGFTPEDDRPLP